ncbi:MAG: hypothetical protein PHT96_06765 [Syntrophorhabdaceae bacterium]|nr:hypothetical protein [Syntrophorhabdaceae bacterium]MDD4196097.1 hypothetical protein [Syntrophorhabdaceae bacterium]HOC45623.1 hypothetical protein [Syntrophorhabdaceae bacterium]
MVMTAGFYWNDEARFSTLLALMLIRLYFFFDNSFHEKERFEAHHGPVGFVNLRPYHKVNEAVFIFKYDE